MKIKLKDLTEEQYMAYYPVFICGNGCDNCIFKNVVCWNTKTNWTRHKDLYSDKFLNQEIEIPEKPTLTEEEKNYLLDIIRPFYSRVEWIKKICTVEGDTQKILICVDDETSIIILPKFEKDTMYKGLNTNIEYTPKELDL